MKRFGYLLFTIPLVLVLWILTSTMYTPYQHNWWRPHRWASKAYHTIPPAEYAFIQVNLKNGETAEFDICLEHGELRRIK